jgi:hypothetical protein
MEAGTVRGLHGVDGDASGAPGSQRIDEEHDAVRFHPQVPSGGRAEEETISEARVDREAEIAHLGLLGKPRQGGRGRFGDLDLRHLRIQNLDAEPGRELALGEHLPNGV